MILYSGDYSISIRVIHLFLQTIIDCIDQRDFSHIEFSLYIWIELYFSIEVNVFYSNTANYWRFLVLNFIVNISNQQFDQLISGDSLHFKRD